MSTVNSKELADLAREVETGDPIDWGMLLVKEEEVYISIADDVISMMKTYNPADREFIAMAACTKLIVENFVLNLKLRDQLLL